jgi:hypothetical protein
LEIRCGHSLAIRDRSPEIIRRWGHHPPVGTYIAILGLLAAAVTLRKDPPLSEKAIWILLMATLMVAEIRNLYIADKEQAATFSAIEGKLEATRNGLDKTLKGLQAEGIRLEGIATRVDIGAKSSQVAAVTATDAVRLITGGESFAYIVPQTEIIPSPPGPRHIRGLTTTGLSAPGFLRHPAGMTG